VTIRDVKRWAIETVIDCHEMLWRLDLAGGAARASEPAHLGSRSGQVVQPKIRTISRSSRDRLFDRLA
jgi:hypothetical protein